MILVFYYLSTHCLKSLKLIKLLLYIERVYFQIMSCLSYSDVKTCYFLKTVCYTSLSSLEVTHSECDIDITLFIRMVVLGRLNELAKEWIIDVSLAKVRTLAVHCH